MNRFGTHVQVIDIQKMLIAQQSGTLQEHKGESIVRSMVFICIVLGVAFLLVCCTARRSATITPISMRDVFMQNEDINELFVQVATTSLQLIEASYTYDDDIHYYYDYNRDNTAAYFYKQDGWYITDNHLIVCEKAANAIRVLKESFPGISIRMSPVEGRMCVFFSVIKKSEGKKGQYYQEDLVYSIFEVSGYDRVDDNWYFRVFSMV